MSELTDLQICKRIADIEGVHYMETQYKGNANFIALISQNDFTGTLPEMIGKYDPLTDDALCFHLMVKYKIKPYYKDIPWPPMKDDFSAMPLPVARDSNEELTTFRGWVDLTNSETLNKSICLAIIEAHKLTLQKESNK